MAYDCGCISLHCVTESDPMESEMERETGAEEVLTDDSSDKDGLLRSTGDPRPQSSEAICMTYKKRQSSDPCSVSTSSTSGIGSYGSFDPETPPTLRAGHCVYNEIEEAGQGYNIPAEMGEEDDSHLNQKTDLVDVVEDQCNNKADKGSVDCSGMMGRALLKEEWSDMERSPLDQDLRDTDDNNQFSKPDENEKREQWYRTSHMDQDSFHSDNGSSMMDGRDGCKNGTCCSEVDHGQQEGHVDSEEEPDESGVCRQGAMWSVVDSTCSGRDKCEGECSDEDSEQIAGESEKPSMSKLMPQYIHTLPVPQALRHYLLYYRT